MKLFLVPLVGFALISGCDGCGSSTQNADRAAALITEPLSADLNSALPRSAYQDAYDQAEAEITKDNAAQRLDSLEKEILRERKLQQ